MGIGSTFTRDEDDSGLNYDDSAFLYFLFCVLLTICVPWTFKLIKAIVKPWRKHIADNLPTKTPDGVPYRYCKVAAEVKKHAQIRSELNSVRRRFTSSWLRQALICLSLWILMYFTYVQTGTMTEIVSFDPFEILGVSGSATEREIKKAYHKLSLKYHPDKNPDDPTANAQFIRINKAYNSLTDETAKENYAKYGNPDGQETMKVGIGLPSFMLSDSNKIPMLMLFAVVILFCIPVAIISHYKQGGKKHPCGVMFDTLKMLAWTMKKTTRGEHGPELMGACAEALDVIEMNDDDAKNVDRLNEIIPVRQTALFSETQLRKHEIMIICHMLRRHDFLSDNMVKQLPELLKATTRVSTSLIELSVMREWLFVSKAMCKFRYSFLQCMDLNSNALLQVPHMTQQLLSNNCSIAGVDTLDKLIALDSSERAAFAKCMEFDKEQTMDLDAFMDHLPRMKLEAKVYVQDEPEIVNGDVITVQIDITREHLKEGEAAGPICNPLFPTPVFEEWWCYVTFNNGTRICLAEHITDTSRTIQRKVQIQESGCGDQKFAVHLLSPCYAGLDQTLEVDYEVKGKDEVKREIFVHQDDIDLDLEPTLFQQAMGIEQPGKKKEDDDSSDDEGDEKEPKREKSGLSSVDSSSDSSDSDSDDDK